jgi:hypothetical protein
MGLWAYGCGVRFDQDGNALVDVRFAWRGAPAFVTFNPFNNGARGGTDGGPLPSMYENGEFIVHGAGKCLPSLTAAIATTYVGLLVDELKAQEHIQLDDRTSIRFFQAVDQAAAEVASAAVLTLPGEKQEGVYTNNFAAVRVASAEKFADLTAEAMRLWNQMNREAEGGPRLVFDVAELKIANRAAVQYSLDLAAADDAPAIPEIRQAMEKLFGPGGKFTLILVTIDEQSVLLAAATPEQVAAMLERLDQKRPIDWNAPQLATANRLLPEQAAWRGFFSPHGFTTWSTRQMDAIVGAPVIGGPLVKEFPVTPPIGVAGGIRGEELWIDIAVPAETIRGAAEYLQKIRRPRR